MLRQLELLNQPSISFSRKDSMSRVVRIAIVTATMMTFPCAELLYGQDTQSDSAAVAGVIGQFHSALENADSAAVLRLLHHDAVILESGDLETRAEYRSHHLPADIAFARAVPRTPGPVQISVRGDVAWATSTSTTRGRYRDRDINSQMVELMVLERSAEGWQIVAIHWSTRNLR
jgi:ketosteroid isomerase-like protein